MLILVIGQVAVLWLGMQMPNQSGDPPARVDPPAKTQSEAAPSSTAVRVKHLESAAIVYLEHRGPYWSMGKLFGQVAALMAEQNQEGPMFARYLDDPAETGVQGLRGQVGFFVEGDVVLAEPFRRAVLGPRWVASMTVKGRYGRSPTAQAKVRSWVRAQGWKAEVAVMEVYPTGPERATEVYVVILKGGPAHGHEPGQQEQALDAESTPAWRLAEYRRMLQAFPRPAPPQVRAVEACVDQLALRISAIGRAAGRTYPQQSAVFEAMSAALLERLGRSGESGPAEASGAIRPQGALGLEGVSFVDMIGQLDRLLVQVTLGQLGAQAALGEFAELTAHLPQGQGDTKTDEQGPRTGESSNAD